jgi:hypothetical protein
VPQTRIDFTRPKARHNDRSEVTTKIVNESLQGIKHNCKSVEIGNITELAG